MGFGVVEQLRQRLETVVGAVDYQRGGDDGKARDRLEVAGRIAGRLVEPMVDGLRAVGAIGQRIAVRLGPRSDGRADIAARARPVFHDDGLAQFARQRFGHQAGQRVAAASCGKGHDQRDGVRGPVGLLRQRGACCQRHASGSRHVNESL
ncbi:hypothetical protein G6F68_013621 [Rhizopus microsporus]|nr:hypothetical protein G6F68_013621 [Rhizopus microsporus]